MTSNVYRCFGRVAKEACRVGKIEVFRDLSKFVEAHTVFSNLVLANFAFIFKFYALFCALTFTAFCVHHLVRISSKIVALLVRHSIKATREMIKKCLNAVRLLIDFCKVRLRRH